MCPSTSLESRTTPKGDYLVSVKRDTGKKTGVLLPDLLQRLLEGLSFPKAMRWNDTGARFARPVRWLLTLYNGKTVPVAFAGLKAGSSTFGHRFLSSGKPLPVKDFKSYLSILEKAGVIVDQNRRREMIVSQLDLIARQKRGKLLMDEGFVDQAVFTVEAPHALAGSFDSRYLDLPERGFDYGDERAPGVFLAADTNGLTNEGLSPHFIAVINMGAKYADVIRAGNERVLAARLADAKFFYDEDRKTPLEARVEQLSGVTFHQKLGTLHQKVMRLVTLAPQLARTLASQRRHRPVGAPPDCAKPT